jgi:hypothetical protein
MPAARVALMLAHYALQQSSETTLLSKLPSPDETHGSLSLVHWERATPAPVANDLKSILSNQCTYWFALLRRDCIKPLDCINQEHLQQISNELKFRFSPQIHSIQFLNVFETIKYKRFPQALAESLHLYKPTKQP